MMTPVLNRRSFLAASAALAATTGLPRFGFAQTAPLTLSAATRTLDIDGRAATVFGLVNGTGGAGLVLDPGQRFSVNLTNALDVDTLIHWHGQIPPNMQDGVPGMPAPLLKPGESRSYDFAAKPGTHWMHSHVPLQEMALLAAPLIVRSEADVKADRQEVVMLLHDFSFKSPEEVMAKITGGAAMSGMAMGGAAKTDGSMSGMDMSKTGSAMSGMDMSKMDMSGSGKASGTMGGMTMDLNDYDFDAYLTNDRTLSDPEIVKVEAGGRVRLRIINGSAATVFWIDTGVTAARLIAVDGHDVQPVSGTRFGLAMGQRLDIEVDLAGGGAFPILALREGAREQTGLILATPGAKVPKLAARADTASPAFDTDLAQESTLRAAVPLSARPATNTAMLMLAGSMQPYVWTINGQTWATHQPVTAKSGERVEIMFHNMSMMGHPMHLHGHSFQVVDTGAGRFAGALRDTVFVPPMGTVTVALDAGEAASWMLHCHHMPHLATGMMTEFIVAA
jgi:FtsP/CotA-like multicopper oxidase with cupredoxin domain